MKCVYPFSSHHHVTGNGMPTTCSCFSYTCASKMLIFYLFMHSFIWLSTSMCMCSYSISLGIFFLFSFQKSQLKKGGTHLPGQKKLWRKRSVYRRFAYLSLMIFYVPITSSAIQSFSCTAGLYPEVWKLIIHID